MLRSSLYAVALAMALFGSAVAGPLEDGVAAYGRADFATAVQLWRPLADQGYGSAQYYLALMYRDGRGVEQNIVEAHVWANLAAARGAGVSLRDELESRMTPAQITEAYRLASAWRPK